MQAIQNAVRLTLNTYLAPYVDNLDAKDFNLSIFSGQCPLFCLNMCMRVDDLD